MTGTVKLSAEERRKLALGGPVTKLLATDVSAETGVFGAIGISAPMQAYIVALKDIENFERGGGFKITKLRSAQYTRCTCLWFQGRPSTRSRSKSFQKPQRG